MSLLGPVFKREPGGRQPGVPLGPFQLRLPFIHFRFEVADYIQGLIMCAVCLGIIPVLTEYLGMPFDIALTIVMLNGFLYLWHSHLGDPVVPGWIPRRSLCCLHGSKHTLKASRECMRL